MPFVPRPSAPHETPSVGGGIVDGPPGAVLVDRPRSGVGTFEGVTPVRGAPFDPIGSSPPWE